MRPVLLAASAALLVTVLAAPASAEVQYVQVRGDSSGVSAGVYIGTGTIAAVGVYYEGQVCVTVGVTRTCTEP